MKPKNEPLEPCRLDANGKPLPKVTCPVCQHELDSASRVEDDAARPSPGDFSVCISCGEILVFTPTMEARLSDVNDMLGLEQHPDLNQQLMKLQKFIRRVRPLRNHED